MRYLSVCAGIEAATCAWHHMGWEPVAFSEIEKFPSAVLAHHYPNVPNWGDMTKYKEWHDANIDVLVGGTPCQSFSVAGLRKGLDDPRGNLMLTFGAIAKRYRPQWLVWENVPGVLSSNGGRDFGAFLGMLAELGYGFAYRVLDAQYFGVAQRRRRVFVVGYLGDWHRAAAVLFERHSLSGHPAPSRQARKGTAGGVAAGVDERGVQHTVGTLCADSHPGAYSGQDAYTGRLVPQPVAGTLGNRGLRSHTELDGHGAYIPVAIQDVRAVEKAQNGRGWNDDGSAYTVDTHATQGVAVAIQGTLIGRSENAGPQGSGADVSGAMFTLTKTDVHAVAMPMQVRRLTAEECEKLQGFLPGYTNIPWRGKPESPDGPRYKALGNSMAVPCMVWIGERINEVSKL